MNANSNQSWFSRLVSAFTGPEEVEAPLSFEQMSPEDLERAYFQGDEATRAAIKKVRDMQRTQAIQAQKEAQMRGQAPPQVQQGPIDAALAGRRSLLDALNQPAKR